LLTKAIFSNMMKAKGSAPGKNPFYTAKRFEHVKPMFEIIWMSVLTGLSSTIQESEFVESVTLALQGFKQSIHITSIFQMDLEMKAFFSTLVKFTSIGNMSQMRGKNFDAIKTLLDLASIEGDALGESWRDVFTCIVQLDKLQSIIVSPVDDTQGKPRSAMSTNSRVQSQRGSFLEEAAQEISSQQMTMVVDRIFTNSVKLNGPAILCLVKALCETSWDEISNSVDKEHPRMYCLQRLVEISYFNMKRIRVEWSNMWTVLGEHFIQVGCYPNTNVGFFAIDKLRQLSMKFLELEELPNFKFQKDFIRPFEEIIRNNSDAKIKDMCLTCLQQMVQAKGKGIRSGWKTIFGSLIRSSRETHESLVNLAFEIMKSVFKNHFDVVLSNGMFADFIACLAEFCKNKKVPKIWYEHFNLVNKQLSTSRWLAQS
jgi:brefeldin A-inhibited guanine nucleotide-exchange protein